VVAEKFTASIVGRNGTLATQPREAALTPPVLEPFVRFCSIFQSLQAVSFDFAHDINTAGWSWTCRAWGVGGLLLLVRDTKGWTEGSTRLISNQKHVPYDWSLV